MIQAAQNQDSKKKSEFTFDAERTGSVDVPSVTKLLNRKSLGMPEASAVPKNFNVSPDLKLAATQPSKAPAQDQPIPIEVSVSADAVPFELTGNIQISVSEGGSQKAPAPPVAKVQLAVIREHKDLVQLILWDQVQMKGGADPLGRGIAALFEKGAHSALFLSIRAADQTLGVPKFMASACVQPGMKQVLWTGLQWDPKVVPELWNHFIKAGFVELAPPGNLTNEKSTRNVVRGAFGLQKEEWLLLVRAGPPNQCRGVLALLSTRSLVPELKDSLALITAQIPKVA